MATRSFAHRSYDNLGYGRRSAVLKINANPILSDLGAALKFEFCMLKNNTQADFQLKISTPGILAAVRRSGEEVIKLQIWCD